MTDNDVTFTESDRRQIAELGLSEEEARRQIALFTDPPPPLDLVRPATLDDGIGTIAKGDRLRMEVAWAELSSSGRIVKFIPASGAPPAACFASSRRSTTARRSTAPRWRRAPPAATRRRSGR